ncbi:hypothetical protein LSH36_171g05016 [Paralvinella palmiformis]|uniref:Uncharacterized protein n=1 Tax=Paralvinella palmiformis TaxID=53620 RepID=A0AAD9JSH6_9ANNE|nr:hypothetical protein LSH36_171g05016 [Paralvinella palmiformis]
MTHLILSDPDAAWHTDLDWLFGRRDYKIRQTPVDPVPHSTSADLTSPGSPDETLYNPPEGAMQVFDVRLPAPDVLSPEYVNYVAALVFYCVRYASVFWYTKMSFSLVFLGQLLVITFHFALSFCGAAILYKFQVNKTIFADLSLVLPSVATLALYVLGDVFLLTSTISVFNYGVQRYRDRWNKFLQEHAPRYWRRKRSRDSGDYPDYGPHAMASVMLLLVILCRGAIVYDYVIVYRKTGFPLILACIVMDAVYMVSWIAMWFAFTLKQNWNFRIMLARYVVATTSKATRSGGGAAKRESTSSGAASASAEKSDGCQLDGSTDVHNVGVLKKSKPKRKTSTQRVKFDESAENDVKDGNEAATDGEHGSRDTSGGERDGDGKNKATGAPSKLTNGNLRRVNSDSTSRHRRHGRQEDYLTESTPENTLTRNYRHSIRDQCGLYFRMSRDLSPAPAAHSSPVPFEKRQDRNAPAEIVLDPLGAARARPTNQKQATVNSVSDGTLSVSYSPDDSPATLLSCSNDSGVQLRRGNADRKLYPTRQDGRYSYPLACSPPDGWLYGRHSRGPPPPYVGREGIPIRHSLHLDRPSIPEDGRLVDKLPPIPWSPDTPARNSEGAPRANGQRTPSPPPRPPKKTQDYTNVYRSRDLKIIPKRPDRDSALPSSNETSSSDSNDVLCSQV